jgi:GGDEF domain-containing protein
MRASEPRRTVRTIQRILPETSFIGLVGFLLLGIVWELGFILRRNEGLTMSFGVASLHSDGSASGDQLVAAAHAALYQAKEAGRNRIVISTPMVGR